jgi:hypothetical protein
VALLSNSRPLGSRESSSSVCLKPVHETHETFVHETSEVLPSQFRPAILPRPPER